MTPYPSSKRPPWSQGFVRGASSAPQCWADEQRLLTFLAGCLVHARILPVSRLLERFAKGSLRYCKKAVSRNNFCTTINKMNLKANEFPILPWISRRMMAKGLLLPNFRALPASTYFTPPSTKLPPLRTGSGNEGIKGEVASLLTSLRRFSFSELEGTDVSPGRAHVCGKSRKEVDEGNGDTIRPGLSSWDRPPLP